MIMSLQDIDVNINLSNKIKNIFLLYDKNEDEIDTILIEEEDYYQLYFDESVLFLNKVEINSNIEFFLEDMDKKVILTIKNNKLYPIRLKYQKNILNISYSNINLTFNINNDILTCPTFGQL